MIHSDIDHIELTDHYTDADTRCAAPGCTEVENSAFDDFVKCEACGSAFCSLCLVRLAELPFCKGCATCQTCGELATCLDDGGDLACAKHYVDLSRLGKPLDYGTRVVGVCLREFSIHHRGLRFEEADAMLSEARDLGVACSIWIEYEGGARLYERYVPTPKAPARVIEWPRDTENCPF